MLLTLSATLPDQSRMKIKALIDTGAEANLIKKGLIHARFLRPARNPLVLVTANGCRMEGGTKEVVLRLCLNSTKENPNGKKVWCSKVSFYEGDIQLDAILSHPWLAQERLGVFPHLEGLARITEGDADPLTILSSWGKKWQENHSLRVARMQKD